MVGLRFGTRAADTSASCARLTGSATNSEYQPRSPRSNTIPIGQPTWPYFHYVDGAKRYIIAPAGLPLATIQSGPGSTLTLGNALALESIPDGTVVHCVELTPGRGAQLARSAGTSLQVLAKDRGMATCECRLAKCGWLVAPVLRQLVALATKIIRTNRSAKRDDPDIETPTERAWFGDEPQGSPAWRR